MNQAYLDCKDAIATALTSFQLLEESLRAYLRQAYLLVEMKTYGQLTVRLPIDSLNGRSLGTALQEFKKFNGNDKLISEIEQLIPERNKLAHKAFFLMVKKAIDGVSFEDQTKEIKVVNGRALECVEQVMNEGEAISTIIDALGKAHPDLRVNLD